MPRKLSIPILQYNPKLKEIWDYSKNSKLGIYPEKTSFGSTKKAWFICALGHEWEAAPLNLTREKTKGNGCPICSGHRLCTGFNDLATTHPELAKELNSTTVDASQISAGSNKKLSWKCDLNHVWAAAPNDRRYGRGCPFCTGRYVLPGFNDLKTIYPDIAKEMDDPDISPEEVTVRSGKKVWWKCGLGHRWKTSIASRTFKDSGTNCPYCCNKKIKAGYNDLATLNPELAKEMFDANWLPTEVSAHSNRKVGWKCSKGHCWWAVISDRASGNGCSKCSLGTSSKVEQEIFDCILNKYKSTVCLGNTRVDIPYLRRKYMFVDILLEISNTKFVIEYDGAYWHADRVEQDTLKTKKLLNAGYHIVRIRDNCRKKSLEFLPISDSRLLQLKYTWNPKNDNLDQCLKEIFYWIDLKTSDILEDNNPKLELI